MNIRQWRRFLQIDVLPASQFAVASSDEDSRQRVTIVLVTVGHVRAIHEDRVVQERSFTLLNRSELAQELGEPIHVPGLKLGEIFEPAEVVCMSCNRLNSSPT